MLRARAAAFGASAPRVELLDVFQFDALMVEGIGTTRGGEEVPDFLRLYHRDDDFDEDFLKLFLTVDELEQKALNMLPPLDDSGRHAVLNNRARSLYDTQIALGLRPNATVDSVNVPLKEVGRIVGLGRGNPFRFFRPPNPDPTVIVPDAPERVPFDGTASSIGTAAGIFLGGSLPSANYPVPPSGFVALPPGGATGGVGSGILAGVIGAPPGEGTGGDRPNNYPVIDPPPDATGSPPDPRRIDRLVALNKPDP